MYLYASVLLVASISAVLKLPAASASWWNLKYTLRSTPSSLPRIATGTGVQRVEEGVSEGVWSVPTARTGSSGARERRTVTFSTSTSLSGVRERLVCGGGTRGGSLEAGKFSEIFTRSAGGSSEGGGDMDPAGTGGGAGAATDVCRLEASGLEALDTVWGSVDGVEVHRVDVRGKDGFGVSFTSYGATLLSVRTADKQGSVEEVTLQYDTFDEVRQGEAFYGSTIGRVCNRISGAEFVVDGQTFRLDRNDGPNCLHSGFHGFDKVVWEHDVYEVPGGIAVRFSYDSPDGESGFPGALAVKATYTIKPGQQAGTGELLTEFEAKLAGAAGSGCASVSCPINLTNHAYWNLSGSCGRTVRGHLMQLGCDRFLPLDENSIPTGEIAPVAGTPFDFQQPKSLGEAIDGVGGEPPGLDNCLLLEATDESGNAKVLGAEGALPRMARLQDPVSGRVMEVFGSQPSLQVYTANYLSEDPADKPHLQHNAVCLETQHFPDAVNKVAWRDSVLLAPGETYLERSRHVFGVDAC